MTLRKLYDILDFLEGLDLNEAREYLPRFGAYGNWMTEKDLNKVINKIGVNNLTGNNLKNMLNWTDKQIRYGYSKIHFTKRGFKLFY